MSYRRHSYLKYKERHPERILASKRKYYSVKENREKRNLGLKEKRDIERELYSTKLIVRVMKLLPTSFHEVWTILELKKPTFVGESFGGGSRFLRRAILSIYGLNRPDYIDLNWGIIFAKAVNSKIEKILRCKQ